MAEQTGAEVAWRRHALTGKAFDAKGAFVAGYMAAMDTLEDTIQARIEAAIEAYLADKNCV